MSSKFVYSGNIKHKAVYTGPSVKTGVVQSPYTSKGFTIISLDYKC